MTDKQWTGGDGSGWKLEHGEYYAFVTKQGALWSLFVWRRTVKGELLIFDCSIATSRKAKEIAELVIDAEKWRTK